MIEAFTVVLVLSLVFYRVVRGPHFQNYRKQRRLLAIGQYTPEDFLHALNDSKIDPPHPLWFRLVNEKRLEFLKLNHEAFVAAYKLMEESSDTITASINRVFDLAQTHLILNEGETFERFCSRHGLTG